MHLHENLIDHLPGLGEAAIVPEGKGEWLRIRSSTL
jgi:hypothetical protein